MLSALATGFLLLLLGAQAPVSATGAQQQPVVEEPGVSGYVLAPDGTPVSGGTVLAQAGVVSTATIDSTGRFRLVTMRSGLHQFLVRAPGLLPYRVNVSVPESKSLRLPVIRLASGAYVRVRLVSPAGEPITAPVLRRQLFDASGKPIFYRADERSAEAADGDGAITIGPLPHAILSAAVDMPFFARTRLPDLNVGDASKIVDAGTVVVQQPGAVLHVDVVDETGAPIPNRDVYLADARPRSPVVFEPERTNQQGRVTFDRLASGRYRVSTGVPDRCANVWLVASRVIPVSGSGTVEMPLVAGGHATFHITSPLGPAMAVAISAAPTAPPLPSRFPVRATPFGCRGATDSDGRVTLKNFPPGPAHVDIRMPNSTYVRQVEVPSNFREVTVAIPEGLLSVHVVNAVKNQVVGGATITWTGSGARVEATATAAGDALLEGVGTAGGTLAAWAPGYQPIEEALSEPPGLPHTVALTPLPPVVNLRSRVITTSGEPLAKAVVELTSTNPADVPRVAVTDAKGLVTFSEVPSGSLRVIASADGFVTATMRTENDSTDEVVFRMSRGYRVIASVALPATAGPQHVRVVNDGSVSMDSVLDSGSDRRVEPRGRVSLGSLAPGAYIVELSGADGRRNERVRIVDRDVSATVR